MLPSSTPGQNPSDSPLGLEDLVGPRKVRTTDPVQPTHGGPTSSAPSDTSFEIMPIMPKRQESQGSIIPTFPAPQRYGTEPTVTRSPPSQRPTPITFPLQTIISTPDLPVSQPLSPISTSSSDVHQSQYPLQTIISTPDLPVSQPSSPISTSSSDVQKNQDSNPVGGKELFETLGHPEGEIPVFDKDNADFRILIRSGAVTLEQISISSRKIWEMFSSEEWWIDAHCTLLDSHFVVVKKETSPTGVNKSTQVIRPIPLEHLRLGSFYDEPEVREHHIGFFKRIGPCVHISPGPTKEQVYPFTVYHAAAKITRRHTIYTKTKRERHRWNVALRRAIELRKLQQDAKTIYTPRILNDGFFKVPPRVQFNRGSGACYTGRVLCAALFSFQWEEFSRETQENYIAIGCTTGVYVSRRDERNDNYSFRKILELKEPNSILVIPEFNKLFVHCESTLSSYPLDKVIRASSAVQGDAAIKDLGTSEEKLSKDKEHVLFVKAGRLVKKTADPNRTIDRIVVIHAVKRSGKVALHLLELKHLDGTSQAPAKYLPLGPPIPIPEEPLDATCFDDKVAIRTSKAIYFVEPMNASNSSPAMVPRIAKEAHEKSRLPGPLKKDKKNKLKIVELVGKAKVLGMVTCENDQDFLLVYDNLGYFVDQAGRHARMDYYIEWERQAKAFARHGPHLLLFSPGYIEVHNIDTGRLFRIVEVNKLRLLRSDSSLTEGQLLIGVMTGNVEDDGSCTEKLVELVYHDGV